MAVVLRNNCLHLQCRVEIAWKHSFEISQYQIYSDYPVHLSQMLGNHRTVA